MWKKHVTIEIRVCDIHGTICCTRPIHARDQLVMQLRMLKDLLNTESYRPSVPGDDGECRREVLRR